MINNFPRIVVSAELRRKMVEIAREFRKVPANGEKILSEYRLVVEVDGPIHEQQEEADKARREILETLGLTVFRIKTLTPEKDLQLALDLIRTKIQELKQNQIFPSPLAGEG